MRRVDRSDFSGPRAYFTDFDYMIVQFKKNREAYRKEIERRLKIILLTKKVVVCAASHLTHEFAYDLFKDNPVLLSEHMILPALRHDKDHVTDYLKGKRIKRSVKDEMKDFYASHIDEVVSWELVENASWFRENLLKALRDERSVIRRNLEDLTRSKLDTLIAEIERNEIITRELILKCISAWPSRQQKILLNFANLIYHMSGARVVNCESALPQENYIDYSLSDFSNHRSLLSDTQVFLKIFFELAFETLHKNSISVELLDTLSFEDIQHLRKPLENSSFSKKYDELVRTSIQIMKDPKVGFYNTADAIEEPLKLLQQISKNFEGIFKQELPAFLQKKRREACKGLRKTASSFGLGVAGLIPYVSLITTPVSMIRESHELLVNLNQRFRSRKEMKDYESYLKYKERLLHKVIDKYSITEKAPLLDALDLIANTIATKISL